MARRNLIVASFLRQKSLYLLWLMSLCVAVTGLVVVDVFRHSLTETLKTQGRKILTADVSLTSRRTLTEDEEKRLAAALPANHRSARLTEMFAMVSAEKDSRLAMLRFISDDYPLIGELTLRDGGGAQRSRGGRELKGDQAILWVAGDMLALMDVKVGERVRVGQLEARIAEVIAKDSSQTFRFGNMAPRVYMHRDWIAKTGLVQFGSTYSDTLLAAFNEPPPRDLKERLEKDFPDPGLQVTVPADLEQGSLRVLSRLLDFLGLTGLITLSLGWIGVYYLGRRWLSWEATSTAILKCLGMSSREAQRLLLTKLMLVLSAGVVLGGGLAWLGANALLPIVKASLPSEFELVWSWKNTALLLLVGPMAGWVLLLQSITQVAYEKPLALFQERSAARASVSSLLVLLTLASLLFVGLTFLQARSWKVTGAFLGALSFSVVLIALLGYLSLRLVAVYRRAHWGWLLHLSTALWTRRLGTSLLLITVSALAGLLSQLLPHLEKTLVNDLRSPQKTERPALFLVDVQDEQLGDVRKFFSDNGLVSPHQSPFIRARILTVNGASFERSQVGEWSTREDENEARFRNRGVNLTFRKDLSPSETIVSGKDWKDVSSDPAEISVEESYANRLGFKLGDLLRFDVQGLEIDARVASLRKIDWDSFQPNFFIQFPEGVLEDAPKTWVMTIDRKAGVTPPQMQTLITKRFPNVTSINVQETLDNISELVGKMSTGLKTSSRLSLGLGVFVFLIILMFQLVSARRDWSQLLVLGLKPSQIWWLQVVSYGSLCLVGTTLGGILSLAVAWGIFRFAFDTAVNFDVGGMIQIWLLTWTAAIVGLTWLGYREIRRARMT